MALELHEKLVRTLRDVYSEEMRSHPEDTAPVALQGFRSTAQEYFDRACAPLIVAWINYRGPGDCVAQKHLHAYGKVNVKTPKNAK